jgi:hypothetical protein
MPPIPVSRILRDRHRLAEQLRESITGPPTAETVENLGGGPVTDLIRDSVWGSISWPKALGRPRSGNDADGFTVTCYTRIKREKRPQGDPWAWLQHPPATLWPVADPDPDLLRVAYYSGFSPAHCCVLIADLVPGAWPDAPPGMRRRIEPLEGFLLPPGPEATRFPPPFLMSGRGRAFLDPQPKVGSGTCPS